MSRRSGRSRKPRRIPRDPGRWSISETGKLRIAIVTSPQTTAAGISLENDVHLVRASILYADEIELVSMGSVTMAALIHLASNDGNLLSLLGALDDETIKHISGGNSLPPNWRESLPRLAALANTPSASRIEAFTELREETDGFRATVDMMFEQSGGADLVPAIDHGILKISSSGFSQAGDVDTTFQDWLSHLRTLLQDTRIRLLLDDQVGDLARSLVDEGHVDMSQLSLRHAGEAAISKGLVARLPAFSQAPTNELLDLRRDLAGPLRRYRSAVLQLSEDLKCRSFDPEFSANVEDLWIRQVDPAITEIREGMAEHGLVREISRSIGADLKAVVSAVAGPAIYVGMETFTSVSNWVSALVATAGAASAAGQAVIVGANSRHDARRELAGHDLFYLYEVNRRLEPS